ncbi:TomO hydrophobic C-terminal domain-containing protein [Wolbachia endosymbiont of Frankliniella intonsa]|uniref:TomO hydrophobic C-terminal domain-containing protein n=1 Tax=Wolbachia endosymbiont of Frankliniella intonsa TaxID=2902422 RepID=UPI00244EAAF8|nr:hypothetical protein [Wolbachia endosymbiont of Frankliniella intonsa]WGJ61629.1 hypothetical protein M3L71_04385 [Wolbachia endosymbiont of Frankliniella intonsa]
MIKFCRQKGFYFFDAIDKIKACLEENRDELKVKLGVHKKSLIDFVNFKDVAVRHAPRMQLCAVVAVLNAPSRNLGNPSNKQLQAVSQSYSSSVDEQVPQHVSETTGNVGQISTNVSEHSEVSSELESNGNQQSTQPEFLTTNGNSSNITTESGSTKIPVSDQKNSIQNNNQQPSNLNNDATRSEKKSKLPIVAASTLAIAGVALGVAIAVYSGMLAVGIAVGVCCLIAAAIVSYYDRPSNSLENSNVEEFVTNEEHTIV